MAKQYRQSRFTAPPGSTRLLLVRHGESRPATESEPFPLVDGHGDPELDPNGVAQAERIAQRLRGAPIDAIYVTSLRRTAQTAAPLCDALGLTPRVEADLREVYLGAWEGGLMRAKAAQKDPIYLQALAEERWDAIPGAESHTQVEGRVRPALHRIATQHPDQLVVAFVHGGIIGHILARACGARPFAFIGADNGSINAIVMDGDRTIIRSYNDTVHLER